MDRRLIEAADKGDVDKLHNLIKDYPLLLKAAALASGETPLHIACTGGHVNFVKEVFNLGLEFAGELNQDGFSPLHIASARGDIEIVKELLKVGNHICLVKGKEKRIPFHHAVAEGRIEVIRELLSACLDSITEVTARGETCFHLAVKSNQFEAFKVLCEHVISFEKEDIMNNKDEQGNTILHLAASRKQYEVISIYKWSDVSFFFFLVIRIFFCLSFLLGILLVLLDVLVTEGGDCEIEEMLTAAGATAGAASPQTLVIATQDPSNNISEQEQRRDRPKSFFQKLCDHFKYDRIKESPSEARNTLLVVAALIAITTYQAVLSPPGAVWPSNFWPDDGTKNNTSNNSSAKQAPHHTAGQSVMGTNNSVSYGLFLFFNSIGFFMSLHMMELLMFGLPLQFELGVALSALVATYDNCMGAITPTGTITMIFIVLSNVLGSMPQLIQLARVCKKRRWYACA